MRNRAKIKCVTYGGKVGWFLRKHFSHITSKAYLELQYLIRVNLFCRYIKKFNEQYKSGNVYWPCLISIETINRCNSTCEFCPANRNADTRPFCRMDEELFQKIIRELETINYAGYLNLYVNNEPFMDTRIEDWYLYAKKHLPQAKMLLYTNGTLVTIERFQKIISCIDKMIINNYSETLELHENVKEIYEYVKTHKEYWDKDICIQIRYIREILTNRAGTAPNKTGKVKNNKICIMPFTDMTIYPDGTVGLCCNDALEKTNYGSVKEDMISEIWRGKTYEELRKKIGKGRSNYSFCEGCDFVDAGIRNSFMKEKLKEGNMRK